MMKSLLTATIAVFLFSTITYAQVSTKEITITVNKKGDKLCTKNTTGNAVFDFVINGLTTQKEIDDFTTKFKTLKGVADFVVTSSDNKWNASATINVKATKNYLKTLLTLAGVKKVIIDGKTILTAELESYRATPTTK